MKNHRDLVGYARNIPKASWPNDASVAIQIVVNYEEGGERSPLYGDSESESFLLEQPTAASSRRDLNAESQYEFGSRSGFWRLHRLLTERNIPVTVFGVASAMAQNPDAVSAMMEAGWEVASHGLRWRSYADVDRSTEHEEIQKAIDLHTKLTGSRPTGWYTGRMSPNTRELLCECGGFLYDSNAFNDELPYWVDVKESKKHLVIPYTHDCNDMRYLTPYGFQFERFSTYLLETLDLFRREGRTCPKMMSVGLHNRISGRAGRARDLERFLDELVRASDVWLATRVAIAEHWHAHHKPE